MPPLLLFFMGKFIVCGKGGLNPSMHFALLKYITIQSLSLSYSY